MRKVYITLFLLLQLMQVVAQEAFTRHIVLVGDIGHHTDEYRQTLAAIKNTVPFDEHTAIIYLGDNIPREKKLATSLIDDEAALADNTKAKVFFIPGNVEWDNGNKNGYKEVKEINEYIKKLDKDNVKIYPKDGCAGFADADFGDGVSLLFMDSEWWLHKYDKPGIESDCKNKTKEQILDELKDYLDDHANDLVVLSSHHPFRSTGKHSNSFGLKQHLFPLTDIKGLDNFYIPLPVIGSLYPVASNFLYSRQNRIHPAYEEMVSSVESVLQWYPYVVRVAGHDHSLQLLHSNEGNYYIVSGAGSTATRAHKGWGIEYKAESKGFVVLEVTSAKDVTAVYYKLDKDGKATVAFKKQLFDYSIPPMPMPDTAKAHVSDARDSVMASVNTSYQHASGFKRLMLGDNYRKEWATPVKMKVFRLNSEKGGMTIEAAGGGKQSKSLHLVDANGTKWTLRSVNKDMTKAIPPNLRETFASAIAQDAVSAAHPYAPLSVPPLASALDVVHTNPEIVFVPNDTALGIYKSSFANTVCMIEERQPSKNGSKGDSGWEMMNSMIEKDDYTVNQKEFLKARMLDILIADFDRHYDQWKWGKIDTGKGKIYYPIPKDRDQVFFHSDGLAFRLIAYDRLPFLKGLKYSIPQIKWMGFSARDIDRLFLNDLTAADWQNVLSSFKASLPDSVLEKAVHQLPPEVYPISGPKILAKLKSRRDLLPTRGMDYYRFLARRVTVTGSNKNDYFVIRHSDSGLAIQVYDRQKNGDTSFLRYSRVFDAHDTKEVWLYGFNGDDYFNIDKDAKSGIKLRMIGGRGADTFNSKGRLSNYIYDRRQDKNTVLATRHTRKHFSNSVDVHDFSFREEVYNRTNFPVISVGYNPDDQLLVGVGVSRTTYGFRKVPFATYQRLGTLFSFFNQAYQVRYDGEFIGAVRGLDLVALAQIKNPALDFFFGLGNETVKDESKPVRFYQARYNFIQGDLLLRKRLARNLIGISLGPSYYKYWNNQDDNTGKVLERPSDVLLDSSQVYTQKLYAGGKLNIRVNNVDNKLLPTHGIDWRTELTMMTGLDEKTLPVARLQSDVAIYANLTNPGRLTSILRFGGGHILSQHFEYFQSFRLGANNYLRGYRRDRFAGSSMAYASAELRLKLFGIQSRILPGDFGIIGFDDIGRVWVKGEQSDTWHNAYGGGIYYTPFNLVAIGLTMGFSNEDQLFNASVGTNIRIFF